MVTRKIAINTIQRFVQDLKKSGYNPTSVLLFGSVAKGRTHKHSDIDVAIWDHKFTGCLPIDIEKLLSVKIKYPSLELHTFHSSETKETNPFIGEILKKCIPIKTD